MVERVDAHLAQARLGANDGSTIGVAWHRFVVEMAGREHRVFIADFIECTQTVDDEFSVFIGIELRRYEDIAKHGERGIEVPT